MSPILFFFLPFSSVFNFEVGKASCCSEHHLWKVWEDARLQPEEVQSVWRDERREHDGALIQVRGCILWYCFLCLCLWSINIYELVPCIWISFCYCCCEINLDWLWLSIHCFGGQKMMWGNSPLADSAIILWMSGSNFLICCHCISSESNWSLSLPILTDFLHSGKLPSH